VTGRASSVANRTLEAFREKPKQAERGTAMKGKAGNGSSKFNVHQDDMGGWLRVHAEGASFPATLPLILSQCAAEWFRKRPNLRLRFIVPIQKDGDTVALHAWFDAHVFPPPQKPPP
jgi:hypothetical protein